MGTNFRKRDNLSIWGNLLIANVWFAAGWVRGGWWPFSVGAVSLVIACLILYAHKISEATNAKAESKRA